MKQSTRNVLLQVITGTMIITLLIWQGMRHRTVELDSGPYITMGTFARVLVVASDKTAAEAALDAAVAAFDRVDTLMNDYDPNSQISEVNRRAFAEPVAVDADIFEVLTASVEYSRLSGGAFDITIAPVVLLWRQARDTGAAPTAERLAEARGRVGWRHLILDPEARTVRFAVEGMALDLGAVAKGYAIDKAAAAMRQAGAMGGMVDIGGDLMCFGRPIQNKPHWYIGLQDPDNEEEILLRLRLDDRAVATSGDYRRFVVIGGQKHSHIIDPVTADGAAEFSSVSVIAPSAMQADALATAVTVMGAEKGLAMLEKVPDTEAILIPSAAPQTFLKTPGAEAYIEN